MDETEFDGDRCVVLPPNYLQSAQAVSEIYEDDLAEAAVNLDVDNLTRKPGFFRGTLLASLIWILPALWAPCY